MEENMENNIIYLNDNNFAENILNSKKMLLIDFWAEWCNPCKIISCILEEIANDFKNQLRIAKLNIEDNPITTTKYNICSIPTLLLFRNNNLLATKVGKLSKNQLISFIKIHL